MECLVSKHLNFSTFKFVMLNMNQPCIGLYVESQQCIGNIGIVCFADICIKGSMNCTVYITRCLQALFTTVKSDLRCTKSQNLNVSHVVLQLSLPNPLKSGPVFYLCLRTCLETVLAKTVLRHVWDRWRCWFSVCLRQKIVLQIQIQVLVNT